MFPFRSQSSSQSACGQLVLRAPEAPPRSATSMPPIADFALIALPFVSANLEEPAVRAELFARIASVGTFHGNGWEQCSANPWKMFTFMQRGRGTIVQLIGIQCSPLFPEKFSVRLRIDSSARAAGSSMFMWPTTTSLMTPAAAAGVLPCGSVNLECLRRAQN